MTYPARTHDPADAPRPAPGRARRRPSLTRRVTVWLGVASAIVGLLGKLAAIVVDLLRAWRGP